MKTLLIYSLFAISAILLCLNRYTALYINNSILHFLIFYTAVFTFALIIGRFTDRLKTTASRTITALIIAILCFVNSFLTWPGDWKTQTVLYQSLKTPQRTIEFQMRGDRFSFGYKKRIVNRLKLFPAFDWTSDIDTAKIDSTEWKKVDKYLNEMKLTEQKKYDALF
jgi:hypothetical protein